jgi:predicted transposase/invertase (TIGR01784 family)
MELLDPKNDFVFKKLFAQAPTLLAELINAVRSTEPPVQVIEVLNPTITPQELTGKFIVLDVLAQDAAGRRYNIEMQARRDADWSARSIYYLARTLTQQLDGGDDYTRLKPVIGIHWLDFDLYEDADQAVWCFELRDRRCSHVRLGDELELNLIELRKADRLARDGAQSGVSTALAAWVTFMEHWQEEARMAQIDYPPVQQALARVRELSADEETRRLAFVRERAVRDERNALSGAREEGRLEGKLEGQAALLERLLARRFGPLNENVLARLQSASAADLAVFADRVLDAPDLEGVFSVR